MIWSLDPAELQLDELFSTAMSRVTGYTPSAHDPPAEKAPSEASTANGGNDDDGQSRRKSSVSVFGVSSRTTDSAGSSQLLSPTENGAAEGTASPPWSSAVGRATTGKSGRVIERIQADNDKLRRDLRLEVLRREEEQKKSEMARSQMQSLQFTNDNLLQMRELDRLSLARKDRKMEELKSDLDGERTRRTEAESQLKQLMRASEDIEAELRAKLREETERAAKATSQYDLLSASWRQKDEDYRRSTERLQQDISHLRQDSADDRRKLDELEITAEQHRQEVEKMKAAKDRMSKEFETYRKEMEDNTRRMREQAEQNEKANAEALTETRELLGQMKHVINLKKYVRGTE